MVRRQNGHTLLKKVFIELEILINSAKNQMQRYSHAWNVEHEKLLAMIADAKLTHTSLPNNYWVNEHRAKAKYQLAFQLLQSLLEVKLEETEKEMEKLKNG